MTLQEEEKSVIQAGVYMVIKSHVKKEEKKKSNTPPPTLAGDVATLPVSCQSRRFKKRIKSPQTKTTDMWKSTFLTAEPLKLARTPNHHLKSTSVVNPPPPGEKVRKQG